jgi:glycosyltransferase involved in cell wall biosynthesis
MAESLGIKGAIHFLGKRLDIYSIIRAFDIFVHPASSDILPTVVIQAMAVGKPVVASAVGGLPEMVCHNITGILVPPEMPQALAEAILRLLKDPDESKKMGLAARKLACSKFGHEKYVENTERIYRELVDSFPAK